jgi:hypothetical protein
LGACRFHQHPLFGCELPLGNPTAWDSWFRSLDKPNPLALLHQISLGTSNPANGKSNLLMAKITIKKMPLVAPRGVHPIRFVGAETETKTSTGEQCNNLVVTIELLGTKDGIGKPFQLTDRYNLNGRGPTAFTDDYRAWSNVHLTREQLDDFDADTLLVNKTAKAEVYHRKDGKNLIPAVAKYLPAEPVTE